MTSPRRRQDRPVESVALKLVFRADKDLRAKIKEAIPSATFRRGNCELRIEGERPEEVADRAKGVLETIRRQPETRKALSRDQSREF